MIGAQPDALLTLAKSREPADRERLLIGIVSLCELTGPAGNADATRAKALVDDLFTTLLVDAEHGVRRRLAERIASARWAPAALIQLLSLDDIDIARPVIASSPLLTDDELIRLLSEGALDHQIAVAGRPGVPAGAVEAILASDDATVLAALAANTSAQLPPDGLARLVEASRVMPALRARLARHPALTPQLAARLFGWAGQTLRETLVERFHLDVAALQASLKAAPPSDPPGSHAHPERADDHDAMEHRLVEKLDAAGQLRPGYLLRALRESKLTLFEIGLARLAGIELGELRGALARERPDMLALACVAAGIDRSVFKTILTRVRELNGGCPGGGDDGESQAVSLFRSKTPKEAVMGFARLAHAPAHI